VTYFGGPVRPLWLDVLVSFAIGVVGELLILSGIVGAAGIRSPLSDLLLPAGVGVVTGIVTKRATAIAGLAAGIVAAFQLAPSLGGPASSADQVSAVLAVGAAAFGHMAALGVRQSQEVDMTMPKPLSEEDRTRLAGQLGAQLRSIDPNAPGAFEHATVLLRQVNEQLQFMGPMNPWTAKPGSTPEQPTELLRIQAELVEVARVSALAAGARRVTISASGMGGGIDVQAVFGDPIAPGEVLAGDGEIRPID
jgi:hypothetical protein